MLCLHNLTDYTLIYLKQCTPVSLDIYGTEGFLIIFSTSGKLVVSIHF